MTKETGYSLTRRFFDFASENSRIVRPVHIAVYCWCVELNNRLAWKDEFQLPTDDGMLYTGILDKHTFIDTVKDLAKWGAIKIIQESKNRFSARYVSLKNCELLPIRYVENPHAIPHAIPHATPTKDKPNKSNKLRKQKKVISDASQSDGIYPACMDLYNKFIFSRTGAGAKINNIAGASMVKIIEYLKTQVKNKDDLKISVPLTVNAIFTNYDKWDEFHKKQLNLNQIESNLINILNAIKNGKSTSSKQPQSKYAPK